MDIDQVKHMEFIQAVIARQAGNSFLIKGWAITVSGAIYGFAINGLNWQLAAVGLAPALIFCFLDAYYLWQERLFRYLYNAVRRGQVSDAYSMDTEPYRQHERYRGALWSRTILPLYAVILFGGIAATAIVHANHPLPPAKSDRSTAASSARLVSISASPPSGQI